MKFYIYNDNYFYRVGQRILKPISMRSNMPWIVVTPDGKQINEASLDDAIKRMNILINTVPA